MKVIPDPSNAIQLPDSAAFQKKRKEIVSHHYPREELFSVLKAYQHEIGNDAAALRSLEKLKDPHSVCIVTGQQLGLMGGPSYTILKAITAILVARENNAIPIFWLATEDHDLTEIDHTFLVDPLTNLKRYRLTWPKAKLFVEDLVLNASHISVIKEFLDNTRIQKLALWKYQEGMSYCQAMGNFLALLFQGTGLVFVEPRLFRPFARQFFKKEILEHEAIHSLLQRTTEKLIKTGKEAVLTVKEGTQLFLKTDGAVRSKLKKESRGFKADGYHFSESEILELVEKEPERFSTNVAARPLLQSLLLPTLAYVGGPTEVQYYQQLTEYHTFHGIPYPLVIQRISATMIPPLAIQLMKECQLSVGDKIPTSWRAWKQKHPHLDHQTLPSNALHFLGNLIFPHHRLQERVLNWCEFQKVVDYNLIEECLKTLNWRLGVHSHVMLEK